VKTRLLAAACSAALTITSRADVSMPVIEYRVVRSIDQVRLSAGIIHDPGLQSRVISDRAAFEREGIVFAQVDSERHFERDEALAGHTVRTEISLYPPAHRGYRGAFSTAFVAVTIDGRKRVDCPWDAGRVELFDLSIMPVDGFVSVQGTYGGKHFGALLSLSGSETATLRWLTAQLP
jgi:hypothetical protein